MHAWLLSRLWEALFINAELAVIPPAAWLLLGLVLGGIWIHARPRRCPGGAGTARRWIGHGLRTVALVVAVGGGLLAAATWFAAPLLDDADLSATIRVQARSIAAGLMAGAGLAALATLALRGPASALMCGRGGDWR
ncbi:MAG: hypothetical protein PHP86_04710 [Nevskiales bacterium]|nr:hypothetical protein [Nevskiales bacterium]